MHHASLLGEALGTAPHYGWAGAEATTSTHDWPALQRLVQNHIRSLNFAYRGGLRNAGVEYVNALASFGGSAAGCDDCGVRLDVRDATGKVTDVSAANVVIAVGGRPHVPGVADVPGAADLAVTSDDIFSLSASPGRTLCVGAGYVALECAGLLRGLGLPVTLCVRSVPLRGAGFDKQCAAHVCDAMRAQGVRFLGGGGAAMKLPGELLRRTDGAIDVRFDDGSVEVFDTVIYATGRRPDTEALHLGSVGVQTDTDGKVTSADGTELTTAHGGNIFCVGDALATPDPSGSSAALELTPVAIMAGERLARRLFGGATRQMDYSTVPTTVFTPIEYGCIGLSEAAAAAKHGADDLDVYVWRWSSLERDALPMPMPAGWGAGDSAPSRELAGAERAPNCMAKLVCLKREGGRIVGFHFVGPNAGEVTQGFALAMRLGATKDALDDVVGIHPTDAEALVTMHVERRQVSSDADWTASGGCGGGRCG
eukprot:g101.t1